VAREVERREVKRSGAREQNQVILADSDSPRTISGEHYIWRTQSRGRQARVNANLLSLYTHGF
jgi:hypothetical protein